MPPSLLQKLPTELTQNIFSYLSPQEKARVSRLFRTKVRLQELPTELVQHVFSFLSPVDKKACVSRFFRTQRRDPAFYRAKLEADFGLEFDETLPDPAGLHASLHSVKDSSLFSYLKLALKLNPTFPPLYDRHYKFEADSANDETYLKTALKVYNFSYVRSMLQQSPTIQWDLKELEKSLVEAIRAGKVAETCGFLLWLFVAQPLSYLRHTVDGSFHLNSIFTALLSFGATGVLHIISLLQIPPLLHHDKILFGDLGFVDQALKASETQLAKMILQRIRLKPTGELLKAYASSAIASLDLDFIYWLKEQAGAPLIFDPEHLDQALGLGLRNLVKVMITDWKMVPRLETFTHGIAQGQGPLVCEAFAWHQQRMAVEGPAPESYSWPQLIAEPLKIMQSWGIAPDKWPLLFKDLNYAELEYNLYISLILPVSSLDNFRTNLDRCVVFARISILIDQRLLAVCTEGLVAGLEELVEKCQALARIPVFGAGFELSPPSLMLKLASASSDDQALRAFKFIQDTPEVAAISTLKKIQANGEVLGIASENGHLKLISYFLEKQDKCDAMTRTHLSFVLFRALEKNQQAVINYLRYSAPLTVRVRVDAELVECYCRTFNYPLNHKALANLVKDNDSSSILIVSLEIFKEAYSQRNRDPKFQSYFEFLTQVLTDNASRVNFKRWLASAAQTDQWNDTPGQTLTFLLNQMFERKDFALIKQWILDPELYALISVDHITLARIKELLEMALAAKDFDFIESYLALLPQEKLAEFSQPWRLHYAYQPAKLGQDALVQQFLPSHPELDPEAATWEDLKSFAVLPWLLEIYPEWRQPQHRENLKSIASFVLVNDPEFSALTWPLSSLTYLIDQIDTYIDGLNNEDLNPEPSPCPTC